MENWVYATVADPLVCDETQQEVAPVGCRVLMLYPMSRDADTGLVSMRLKRANAVTGQLTLTWVTVYDSVSDLRHLEDFSLTP